MKELHIIFRADIEPPFCEDFKKRVSEALSQGLQKLVVYLDTQGGYATMGYDLYTFLKGLKIKTVCYNTNAVASAGMSFFMGFEERLSVPQGSFMIHESSWKRDGVFPDSSVSYTVVMKQLGRIRQTDEQQCALIEYELKKKNPIKLLTGDDLMIAMSHSTFYGSVEARRVGFIDRIEHPEIPTEDSDDIKVVHIVAP